MFETCKDEKDAVSSTFTNIPVSLYPHSTKELLLNKHIFIKDFNDSKVATYGLKGSAVSAGTRSSYVHALLDIKTENMVGSFGVECLSQGASHVTFIEKYKEVLPILKKNLNSLKSEIGY